MKRILLILGLALLAVRGFAAIGDIDWMTIPANGWEVDIHVNTLGTNGTYVYGLGPSNSLTGFESVQIQVTSPGFDDAGNATNFPHTIVGTYRLRYPYPSQAFAYEVKDGTGVKLRVALSDYINANDTIVSGMVTNGFYTQGTPNNAYSVGAFTNLSGVTAPKPLMAWTWPDYFLVGSNFNLSLFAFHWSAQSGRMVRAVQFYAVDSLGNRTPTNTVTNPIIDATQPDAMPIIEYVTTIDGSGLAQGSTITRHAVCWGFYGPKLDTSDGVNPAGGTNYCPSITYCDKSNVWNWVGANVDPNAANDNTGVAVTNKASWLTAPPFKTAAGALNACGSTNNGHGSNNYENCFIAFTNGNYDVWGGASVVSRNASKPWTVFQARSDVDWHTVKWTTSAGANGLTIDKTVKICISNMVCAVSGFVNTFGQGYGNGLIIASEIDTNMNAVSIFSSQTNLWLVQTTINGMRQYPNGSANQKGSWTKTRGCTILDFDGVDARTIQIVSQLFFGNKITPSVNTQYGWSSDGGEIMDPFFCGFNYFGRQDGTVVPVSWGLNGNINNGGFIGQNLLENVAHVNTTPSFDAMQSQKDNEFCTNVMVINNTDLGNYHPPYNLGGFQNVTLDHYMDANNLFGALQVTADVTGGGGNASNTNRWVRMESVGCFGNATANYLGQGSNPAGAEKGFDGIPAWYFTNTTIGAAIPFVRNAADATATGGTGAGLGDYRLQTGHPLTGQSLIVKIPWDLAAKARTASSPPGAYNATNAIVAGNFFWLRK